MTSNVDTHYTWPWYPHGTQDSYSRHLVLDKHDTRIGTNDNCPIGSRDTGETQPTNSRYLGLG